MNAGTTASAVGKTIGSPTRPPHADAMRRSSSDTSGTSHPSSSAHAATSRASGPAWSKLGASGKRPSVGTTPYDGLNPTTPQHAAGMRIEPPVSLPSAASAWPRPTAAADPPEDPPAVSPGNRGFGTTP